MVGPETGFIHVKTGCESMYILQLVCENSACSFKIFGGQLNGSSSTLETLHQPNQNLWNSASTVSFSDFIYSPGDSIKISTYKSNMYHGEKIVKPVNNDTISTFLSMPCPGIFAVYDYDENAYTEWKSRTI